MNAKAPWVKFFHRDFVHGCRGLSEAEVGRYIRVLAALWDSETSTLSADPETLHLVLDCRRSDAFSKLQPLLDKGKIFLDGDGQIRNRRIEEENMRQAQLALKFGRTYGDLRQNLKPHKAERAMKSNGATRAGARASVSEPDIYKSSTLGDVMSKSQDHSTSLRRPPDEGGSSAQPKRKVPDFSGDKVEPSNALLKSPLLGSAKVSTAARPVATSETRLSEAMRRIRERKAAEDEGDEGKGEK